MLDLNKFLGDLIHLNPNYLASDTTHAINDILADQGYRYDPAVGLINIQEIEKAAEDYELRNHQERYWPVDIKEAFKKGALWYINNSSTLKQ